MLKNYHQTDNKGVYLYSKQYSSKPHRAVSVAVPTVPTSKLAQWETSLHPVTDKTWGEEGTGQWVIKDDHRKVDLYQTADGSKYELDQEVEGQTYNGIGPVPAWLTLQERPSKHHNWVDDAWMLDVAAKLNNDKALERAWRDAEISKVAWLRDRHRDELEQGLPTTLTGEQYSELVEYIQALRDWPAAVAFPAPASRPIVPAWLVV